MAEEPQPRPQNVRRGHVDHVAPMACERGVCVLPSLHEEFVRKVGGDDEAEAERVVKAFYTDVMAGIPTDEVIAEDKWDFWRRRFATRFRKDTGPVYGFPAYVPPVETRTPEEIAIQRENSKRIFAAAKAKIEAQIAEDERKRAEKQAAGARRHAH
jgi:hypothetical protein